MRYLYIYLEFLNEYIWHLIKTDHFLKREGKENTNKIQPKFTQSRFNLLFCIQCTDISTKSRSNAIKHWATCKIQQVKYLINSCK